MKAFAGIFAVVACSWIGGAASARAAPVDYLYLEANVGGSSGGHVALRFDDVVFDYRLGDGHTLRLHRTHADSFRQGAQVLGNRTIRAARVEVSDDRREQLLRRFHRRHLIANRTFDWVEAVREERRWLEAGYGDGAADPGDPGPAREAIAGAGLFDLDAERSEVSVPLAALRARVAERYGESFLRSRIAAFESELSQLRPTLDDSVPSFAPDVWPRASVLFSERRRELATWVLGLRALERAVPVRPEVLRSESEPALRLDTEERRALAVFSAALADSLVELVASPRGDAGLALLVGLARLEALECGLEAGRLRLLDAFPADAEPLAVASGAPPDPYLVEWEAHVAARFAAARARLGQSHPLREQDYARIEETGNLLLELREGLTGRRAIRSDDGLGIPAPVAVVAGLPRPALSEPEWERALAAASRREARATSALRDAYGYDLISRNCVTELFATIGESLRESTGDRRLGLLGFIPFVSFGWFERTHDVTRVWEEPSLRRARVAERIREENDLLVFARESNTLTSTVYRRHDGEGLFLFFTDDRPLLRPVFGALNLGAGLAQAAYGVARIPFEGTRTLRAGLASAGYSLPELLFVNIRKGTLRYGPGTWPAETDAGSPPPST